MKMFSVEVVLITTAYVEAPGRDAAIASLTRVVGKPYVQLSYPGLSTVRRSYLGRTITASLSEAVSGFHL